MKKILLIAIFLSFNTFNGQVNLPVDFENAQVTNEDFINFNGGAGYVVYSPQIDDENASESVGVIIRDGGDIWACLLYTSPSPRDMRRSRMPSSA